MAAALAAAKAGDTIEILDAAEYSEPELVIDKAITLTSTYLRTNPTADPADPAFNPRLFPSLVAAGTHRVIRVQGAATDRNALGPVVLRGVRVRGGQARQSGTDPGIGNGGGIAVIDADRVTIERCVVSGNRTEAAAVTAWSESDRVALRTAVVGVAGEIFSATTASMLNTLVTNYNRLVTLTRIGNPLTPINRTTILTDFERAFDRALPTGRSNYWIGGQAFGGGIATVWASPTVKNCRIVDNHAEGRGSGLAVVGFGWPRIERCWINENTSASRGRRDGGGIGMEICLPTKLGRNLSEIDLVRFLTVKINSLKSVIASPASSVGLADLIAFGRWLLDTRSHPVARGVKAIVLDALRGKVSDDLLYYCATAALSRFRWEAWNESEVTAAKANEVGVENCRVTANRCDDDGGGLYASVLSRVAVKDTVFERNRCPGMGGGLRLTMGSDGKLEGCTVSKNHSDRRGGGIAGRNASLTLTRTTVGDTGSGVAPRAAGNTAGDSPGGGIAVEVGSEGKLAGIPNLWTSILREVFTVHAVSVTIDSASRVAGNGAGFNRGRSPIPRAGSAKGGGFYCFIDNFPDSPSVAIEIADVATTVTGNTAVTAGYVSKVDSSITVSRADERCLQDLKNRNELTEVTDAPLRRGGTYRYSA